MISIALRLALFGLAFVHSFPARRHLCELFAEPSLAEAWKGFGALLAIAVYLLPPRLLARGIVGAWRVVPRAFTLIGGLLALAHAVPAADHLPNFFAHPSFADAWRGFGSVIAFAWFMLPLHIQARAIAQLRHAAAAPLRVREIAIAVTMLVARASSHASRIARGS